MFLTPALRMQQSTRRKAPTEVFYRQEFWLQRFACLAKHFLTFLEKSERRLCTVAEPSGFLRHGTDG